MKSHTIRLPAVLAFAFTLAACQPTHERALAPRATGNQYTLAITNPNPYPMSVLYSNGEEQTVLGMIQAGETKEFTIPDRGGDGVEIIANDPDKKRVVTKEIDLDKGQVNAVSLEPR